MLRRRMMMGQGESIDYSQMYLTVKALEGGTFTITYLLGYGGAMYYSVNGGTTWNILHVSGTDGTTPYISAGSEVLFKCTSPSISGGHGFGTFTSTGNYEVYGNIMSMYYGDDFADATTPPDYLCSHTFVDSTKLISAKNLVLPANTSQYCYSYMFSGCSGLLYPPKIPSTTFATYCCEYMFNGCTAMLQFPTMDIQVAGDHCSTRMFVNCSSVINADNVRLSATSLQSACYSYMFNGCTALERAPELPATTLPTYAYTNMFSGCTSLAYIKCLATNISASYALTTWTRGVAASGTFVKAASMSSWPSGENGIPSGWTVQNA